jgi:hypothetical protein
LPNIQAALLPKKTAQKSQNHSSSQEYWTCEREYESMFLQRTIVKQIPIRYTEIYMNYTKSCDILMQFTWCQTSRWSNSILMCLWKFKCSKFDVCMVNKSTERVKWIVFILI